MATMKSSYELAMERLNQEDPSGNTPLSDEKKAALEQVDRKYEAKIAEREVFLGQKIKASRASGNREDEQQLQRQLSDERNRLNEERDNAKEAIRKGN